MTSPNTHDPEAILERLRDQARREALRLTQHAQQEMAAENILLDDVLDAIGSAHVLENYTKHRRGPCCLLAGYTRNQRPLHIVCSTSLQLLIVITAYEPKPPKWVTPTERGHKA